MSRRGPDTLLGFMGEKAADRRALDDLVSEIYEELKSRARSVRKSFPNATISPTALVNEAWAKLRSSPRLAGLPVLEFKRVAGRAMRQVLVEAARRQGARKRGRTLVTFDEETGQGASDARQIIEIDLALDELAEADAEQAQIVEYRFFVGMKNAEIAQMMGIGLSSVERAWRLAAAWLRKRLRDYGDEP